MNRGIVMEIGKRHVVVLTPDGQFRKVPSRGKAAVGEEIRFSEPQSYRNPRTLHSALIGAAAIVLVLFLPLLVKPGAFSSPVIAYLTMDINPSIELGVNKYDEVEELRAINADGATVTQGLDYKGLPVEKVAELIMDRVDDGPYFKGGEGDVVITTVVVDKEREPDFEMKLSDKVDKAVHQALSNAAKTKPLQVEVTTLSAPSEIREEASKAGVSSGKMAFYLMAKNHGYEVPLEELKTHSIHEVAKSIGGLKAVVDDDKDMPDQKQIETQKQELKELLKKEKKAEKEAAKDRREADKAAKKDEAADKKKDSKPNGSSKSNKKDDGESPGGEKKAGLDLLPPGLKDNSGSGENDRRENGQGSSGNREKSGERDGRGPQSSGGGASREKGKIGNSGQDGKQKNDRDGEDKGKASGEDSKRQDADDELNGGGSGTVQSDFELGDQDRAGGLGSVNDTSEGRHPDVKEKSGKSGSGKKEDGKGKPDGDGKSPKPHK